MLTLLIVERTVSERILYMLNLFLAAGSGDYGILNAINGWMDEASKYDYNNPGFSSDTGHFAQVVWKATKQLVAALPVPSSLTQTRSLLSANMLLQAMSRVNSQKTVLVVADGAHDEGETFSLPKLDKDEIQGDASLTSCTRTITIPPPPPPSSLLTR
ncbi:hypothetical protein D9758_004712 [Tetrapyrgos nigripes]|uniref:SCP domain-containing protein n=1 Tax=Tetrapyrgos nigripes TaxID=182062 RepID=A0A8H5H073_9AGAR|nr:hypothetical protein D9758_004712 [Tetrapyrgos nigripes]